jgi:hypothetical protein
MVLRVSKQRGASRQRRVALIRAGGPAANRRIDRHGCDSHRTDAAEGAKRLRCTVTQDSGDGETGEGNSSKWKEGA